MPSFTPELVDKLMLTVKDGAMMRALGEHRGRELIYSRQRSETLASLHAMSAIESARSSSKLDGIDGQEALDGYRDALDLIHDAGDNMPVNVNTIRHLHQVLHRYLPDDGGLWQSAGSDAATQRLVDDYARATSDHLDPLLVIPFFVLDFMSLQPFSDGNGRVARLLTTLLLHHAGFEIARYISLERIHELTRRSYHETLEASSRNWQEGRHDVMPWTHYFWGVLLRAYREFEERVGMVNGEPVSKSERVRDAAGRRIVPFRIRELERDVPGVSRETIRLVLRQMKRAGLIESEGHGRGARWVP